MSISIFLNFPGSPLAADAMRAVFVGESLPRLTMSPGLQFIETYQPAAGEVPAFQDGPGAPLLAELNVDSVENAERLIRSPVFGDSLAIQMRGGEVSMATVDLFQPVHYPVPGYSQPPPRTAPLSFVVRYYGPVENEADFVDFYTRNHPPLLARFPGIRNVLCYLPVPVELPDGLPASGAFLGNEVVFDSLDALNTALGSEVLELVKADGRRFAKFGHNTHHPMARASVFRRTDS